MQADRPLQKENDMMRLAKHLVAAAAVAGLIGLGGAGRARAEEKAAGDGFVSLFNGKDLSGWEATGKARFLVEDGCLVGTQTTGAGGDLFTRAEYDNFEMRVTYRVVWPANSGFWFRYGKSGYQYDVLKYKKPVAFSGTLYCPGKMFITSNLDESIENRDGWNEARVWANGDHLILWLNGKRTGECRDKTLAKGRIGIQVHGGNGFKGMRIIVKRIEVRPVKADEAPPADDDRAGFVSLFNGKDLTGWDAKPNWWYVEDGAITSQTTREKPCKKCNYLIWKGGKPGDFELRLKYKLVGGNSGIQFRSQRREDWDTFGYQADMDAAGTWTGCVFAHARGKVAGRGTRTVIDEKGKKTVTQIGDPAKLLKHVKLNDWNEYRIIAKGPKMTLMINGVVMCEAVDHQKGKAALDGIIALQVHPGPPMKVQFKDILLKKLTPHPRATHAPTRGIKSPISKSERKAL